MPQTKTFPPIRPALIGLDDSPVAVGWRGFAGSALELRLFGRAGNETDQRLRVEPDWAALAGEFPENVCLGEAPRAATWRFVSSAQEVAHAVLDMSIDALVAEGMSKSAAGRHLPITESSAIKWCKLQEKDGKPRRKAGQKAGAHAEQIADHNEAGGDADAHLQGDTRHGILLRRGLDEGEPGAHGPLGVMLVGAGIAELDQHPVTHVFGDEATVALDPLRAAAVIGANYAAQVLRIP